MFLHLRSLAAFLRDVCAACRPPADDLMAVMDATAEPFDALTDPEPEPELPPLIYHAVVSEMAEALADLRAAAFGAEDFAEWSRELMFEDER